MQTIQFQIEDELYENIKDHQLDLQSKFKEFLSTLTDDGFPSISTEEAKKRVSEAMELYKSGKGDYQPINDEFWNDIDKHIESV